MYLRGALVRALQRYSVPSPAVAELGGAGSCAYESVRRVIQPSVYHVIELGLELLASKAVAGNLLLHRRNIVNLDLDLQLNVVSWSDRAF